MEAGRDIFMVFKLRHKTKYTSIANEMLISSKLTWQEKGFLAYLLSKPTDWEFKTQTIADETGCSHDVVCRLMNRLIVKKYAERDSERYFKPHPKAGQFRFVTYTVYELPKDEYLKLNPMAEEVKMLKIREKYYGQEETTEPLRNFA